MDVSALSVVLLVSERGSFSAAARVLRVDPSSVSRTAAAVEAEIGLRLFQRSTRRLAPTEEGEAYLSRIAPLVEELERAREEAVKGHKRPSGTLRLTASVAFGTECIVPLLGAFREALPDVSLELILSDGNLDLVGDKIDLALRLAPAPEGDLISTRLLTTRYLVCASPDWIAREEALARPGDLQEVDCLLLTLPDYRSSWIFRDAAGDEEEIPVHGPIAISNPLALKEAALIGQGPALLADWLCAADLASGNLVDLFPDHDVTATNFDTGAWVLYPSRSYLPAKVRATIDFLRASLA